MWGLILCMQADMDNLPDILSAISDDSIRKLQDGITHVWQRFLYRSFKAFPAVLHDTRARYSESWESRHNNSAWLPHTVDTLREDDDAFATIMQWLSSRRVRHNDAMLRLGGQAMISPD